MPLFVRTAFGKSKEFTTFYKSVETVYKKDKFLNSNSKSLCKKILKDGEHFFDKVEAKTRKDYEKMITEYLKTNKKTFDKVLEQSDKAKKAA